MKSCKGWDLSLSRAFIKASNGKRVKFWKDKCCGKEPLCISLPSLYAMASSKEAWVTDLGRFKSEGSLESMLF